MTAREGLIFSKNTITAQIMQQVGPRRTADLARAMGVSHSKLDEVPSLALGTSPVTPFEMITAYSTLASGGEYRQPLYISRITDKYGNVLAEFVSEKKQILSDKTVENLINTLRDAVDRGTGQAVRAQFGVRADVAGKTGTTQENTDGWFILMHPRLVAGAWVGFNDSRVTMRSDHWGGGGQNALLLVGDFFRQSLDTGLVDGRVRFPYARPSDSIWDPYLDAARDWLFGTVRDWLFGDPGKRPSLPPRTTPRDLPREPRRERFDEPPGAQWDSEKERLMERLRQKREQREEERREREVGN